MNHDRCIIEEHELNLLRKEALPFFHEHLEEFKNYVIQKLGDDSNASLWKITLDFISHLNLPFNMQRYMRVQTQKIRQCLLDNHGANCDSNGLEKQKLVAAWIKKEAQSHRENQIEAQKICLNQFKEQFEEALCKELCGCDIPHPLLEIIMGHSKRSA